MVESSQKTGAQSIMVSQKSAAAAVGNVSTTSVKEVVKLTSEAIDAAAPATNITRFTPSTLALAVALPIVFLLALFAFIFFFGIRRRGWFLPVSVKERRKAENEELMEVTHAKGSVLTTTEDGEAAGVGRRWEVGGQELGYQADGAEIHQLMGDEEWRRGIARSRG